MTKRQPNEDMMRRWPSASRGETSEEAKPPAPSTFPHCEKIKFSCLNHSVCNLLCQLQRNNTMSLDNLCIMSEILLVICTSFFNVKHLFPFCVCRKMIICLFHVYFIAGNMYIYLLFFSNIIHLFLCTFSPSTSKLRKSSFKRFDTLSVLFSVSFSVVWCWPVQYNYSPRFENVDSWK